MAHGNLKQFKRPPKKQKQKTAPPETADEYQEAADSEENAGGKHRAGDPVKSGRAFIRALDIYDTGLSRYPSSFDLAYNKARLQLEISQQPNLVEHIGVPILEWLQITASSHRYALRLSDDNADALFNTAQVLSSLAEQLLESERTSEAVPLLHEAVGLLSNCLSRQEILLEQHQLDFPDAEDGGVMLSPPHQPTSTSSPSTPESDVVEQSVTVEVPVGPDDLLDTVHASLSALTTLVPLTDPSGLQTLGDMVQTLTEIKASQFINLMQTEMQMSARFAVALDRATFVAAYSNSQFEHGVIELQTYVAQLEAFNIPDKDNHANILHAEAEARGELVLAAFDHFGETSNLPAALCWKQLGLSQELLSKAARSTSHESNDRPAQIYESKGDTELLRYRLANISHADLSESVRRSALTLVQNAQKFYTGAAQYAQRDGDDELAKNLSQKSDLAARIEAVVHHDKPSVTGTWDALQACVEGGLVSQVLAQTLVGRSTGSRS